VTISDMRTAPGACSDHPAGGGSDPTAKPCALAAKILGSQQRRRSKTRVVALPAAYALARAVPSFQRRLLPISFRIKMIGRTASQLLQPLMKIIVLMRPMACIGNA